MSPTRFVQLLKFVHREAPWFLPITLPLSIGVGFLEGIGIGLFLVILGNLETGSDVVPPLMAPILEFLHIEPDVLELGLLILGIILLKAVLHFAQRTYSLFVALDFDARTKLTLFNNLLLGKWTSVQDINSGRFVNTQLVELKRAKNVFSSTAEFLVRSIFVAVYVSSALLISAQGSLAAFGVTLVFGVIYYKFIKYSGRLGERFTSLNFQAQHFLQEGLNGMKFIKSVFISPHVFARYGGLIDLARQNQKRFAAILQVVSVATEPLTLIVVGVVGYIHLSGGRDVASLIALCFVFFRLYGKFSALVLSAQSLANITPAIEAITGLRKETSLAREGSGGVEYPGLREGVEFRHVSYRYPNGRSVLIDCDLTFRKGQRTALVGESGAGKSTIVDLLIGLLKPGEGEILIDGRNLDDLDIESYRTKLGVLGQEPILFDDSIANNIRLQDPSASAADIESAARVAFAHEFIEDLPDGYDTLVGERGVKLSGGQRQRIALARAILATPDILILDEPASSLDVESENKIKEAMKALGDRMTVVIVAHRASTIEDADVVYRVVDGQTTVVTSSTEDRP